MTQSGAGKLTKQMKQRIEETADAHTRLNVFYSLIAILEGGCLPGGSPTADATAQKIIVLCKAEGQRQLAIFDAGSAALAAHGGRDG